MRPRNLIAIVVSTILFTCAGAIDKTDQRSQNKMLVHDDTAIEDPSSPNSVTENPAILQEIAKLTNANLLSQTGLYKDSTMKELLPDFKGYSPSYPLWTDGASKKRWISLPKGGKIDASNPDDWVFPKGTIVVKEFAVGERRLETRILVKNKAGVGPDAWYAMAFQWNKDQTDATSTPEGATIANAIQPGVSYEIPSAESCRSCHNGVKDVLIGFSGLQLPEESASEPGDWTLAELGRNERFTAPLTSIPALPDLAPETQAALGYLHGNCGHCHNPRETASASRTGIMLSLQGQITSLDDAPAYKTTNGKSMIAGNPNASRLIEVMENLQMPKIGVSILDAKGLQLVKDWIEDLPTDL